MRKWGRERGEGEGGRRGGKEERVREGEWTFMLHVDITKLLSSHVL